MEVQLAYGTQGLALHLEDTWNVRVIEPAYLSGLRDEEAAVRDALRRPLGAKPLAKLVKPGDLVGIIVNDITRATPTPLLLRVLLAELSLCQPGQITLFIALGTHRPVTVSELEEILGPGIVDVYPVVQNDAFNPASQICIGSLEPGRPLWVNRQLAGCNLKILTGFIEPHFFAGFSGGGKAIMPGMAGIDTVLGNHDVAHIAHPNATWGITQGNPIWEEARTAAYLAGPVFLLNVALNRERAITGVFAGDLDAAHAAGVAHVRQTAIVELPGPFDIVVTTNSGYPLDRNLYQAVKGLSAAACAVRPGGAIVLAAECRDGLPADSMYARILRETQNPQRALEAITAAPAPRPDQWQVQIQAQVQQKAEVYVYSHCLSRDEIRGAQLNPVSSVETALQQLLHRMGPAASICILPEGPQTIPVVAPGTK